MATGMLVTGATGFVGGRLASVLALADHEVRCLVRDRTSSRARELEAQGFALHEGDVLRAETLRGAGRGVDVAYYLIHSMGWGGSAGVAPRERAAATAFARMARTEGSSGSSTWVHSATSRDPSICAAATSLRSSLPSTGRR